MKSIIKNILAIRHYLHANPELSLQEVSTAEYVSKQLLLRYPDELITGLGGNGIAALYDSHKPGYTLCFRADLDALPIEEQSTHTYQSKNKGVSHACGHDGHSSILLAFAQWLNANPGKWPGKIILLFQPAEEIAQGALTVLKDTRFTNLKPDFIFGMHNIPGYPLGALIIKDKVFASASQGLKVKLTGKTSHASHPEDGNSPLQAMVAVFNLLNVLASQHTGASALVTIIHARLGEEAFGTSPGEAEIMATFRANNDDVLQSMASTAEAELKAIAAKAALQCTINWVEVFAATVNSSEAVNFVEKAAGNALINIVRPEKAFAWSEDFSFYTSRYKSCFFGLGAGEEHPQLHNPDYDFPDELIETALKLYTEILLTAGGHYAALKLD
jgi:amidohydrolase